MAIDVAPISSLQPAFLRLTPSILDAAHPQIEPVGYNQRYNFVGPTNPLEQTNETSPTYLRAFLDAPTQTDSLNEPVDVGMLGGDALASSRAALRPEAQQLGLFGSGTEDAFQQVGLNTGGLAQYAAVQGNDTGFGIQRGLSISV